MSHAHSPYTTSACLLAADESLGADRVWNAVSDVQRAWLVEQYLRLRSELVLIPEIAANATYDVDDHVAFMKKHEMEAQLTEKTAEDDFLMAAAMSVVGGWQKEGHADLMSTVDGYRHAVQMLDGAQILKRRGTDEFVARLATKTDDSVWMEMMPSAPEGVALSVYAQDRFGDLEQIDDYDGVTFPCIDWAGSVDNAWLKELWTRDDRGRRAKIKAACAQFELKMNHVGFRARAADEMLGGIESTAGPKTLQINRPFLMAISRSGPSLPLFTAHLEPDAWNKPDLKL